MPGSSRPGRHPITRDELPDQFTPETVRQLDMFTARRLSQPHNGILTADEQRSFDQALRTVMQDTADRLEQSLRRVRRGGPGPRRPRPAVASVVRSDRGTSRRTGTADPSELPAAHQRLGGAERAAGVRRRPRSPTTQSRSASSSRRSSRRRTRWRSSNESPRSSCNSSNTNGRKCCATSRGVFFALLVSVAVIVAGVTPLVEASPDDRRLILVWTLVICAAAGVVYAIVRARQSKGDPPAD